MLKLFEKPYRFAKLYALLLTCAAAFVLLDTFVVPKAYSIVTEPPAQTTEATNTSPPTSAQNTTTAQSPAVPTTEKPAVRISDRAYEDENIRIAITTTRAYDTTVHIAEVQIKDVHYLKTAFADNTFGRNITANTSQIAKENNAIFAINGDYCGFRGSGYVLRNGVLYRSTGEETACVLDETGQLSAIPESLLQATASYWQIWSFGPVLLDGGIPTVDEHSEISGRTANSNPRTAIGQIAPLHFCFVVSEGRTSGNAGLSLLQLAQVCADRGCTFAYNLDGGGSSTMWFNGQLVNAPSTGGNKISERAVSDIVFIGY
ncbi:MAG: phosphodiester glycosidase family protein [Oscillospiraceae bacterium]|nr:phosphodiester glycosidase family protein [Oscillospiraceae bacterium]